jgi:glycosyltransferase involved in cell wall biosynthesis
MPANTELVKMDWLEEPAGRTKKRALVSREAARVLLWTLRTPNDLRRYMASRMYLDILARNILKLRSLTRLVRERDLGDALFYDYWFENSTLALALLRRSGEIRTAVSRAHRFDIYDEAWDGQPVPFRGAKAHGLDAVFAVSASGVDYLHEHIPLVRGKVSLQRLGVRDPGRAGAERTDTPPLVVTCASLLPRKRVHLVPEVLACLGRPVRWVHLGDGPERRRVEAAAEALDRNVTWTLAGQLPNRRVLDFYKWNHVDALLSLSLSEGVPVSMMEAQSYGIPVVGCGVGGVPEIIDDRTGILLDVGASAAEMAEGLAAALEPGRFDRGAVRRFFQGRFEARSNYNAFAETLIALHGRRASAV